MGMTLKLNIDNGLRDWKTEHHAVYFIVEKVGISASNKLLCNLTGQYFEIGNKNIPPNC